MESKYLQLSLLSSSALLDRNSITSVDNQILAPSFDINSSLIDYLKKISAEIQEKSDNFLSEGTQINVLSQNSSKICNTLRTKRNEDIDISQTMQKLANSKFKSVKF